MNSSGLEVLKIIRTSLMSRGAGVEGDPYRRIEQYWDMDGNLILEYDPYREETKWYGRF